MDFFSPSFLLAMDLSNPYYLIIGASAVIILSFIFGEISQKTNIPSVLMLIVLGVVLQKVIHIEKSSVLGILEVLGIVGLIMIVLEAALELELKPEKYVPIVKALVIALIGLIVSAYVAAKLLNHFVDGMSMQQAWFYATPLSILSSAIIIPSVSGLSPSKREFHIYESTFSDILGIMMFIFLRGQVESSLDQAGGGGGGVSAFAFKVVLTIFISFVASYLIILIFQSIKSHIKLFLLIAVLLLLYSVGKKMGLSSLLIILVFGLIIANMKLFFRGPLGRWLEIEKAEHIYEGLHVITMETAFVIRTFFFVFFGLSIVIASIFDPSVAMVSILIIISIYVIRYAVLKLFIGSDIIPQLYIAPRGLITVLLFYQIPSEVKVATFNEGILLFIIIGTSLIMTVAMVRDKQKTSIAVRKAEESPVGYEKWKAPTVTEIVEDHGGKH